MSIRFIFTSLNVILGALQAIFFVVRLVADLVGYSTLSDDKDTARGVLFNTIDWILSVDATIVVLACVSGSILSFLALSLIHI